MRLNRLILAFVSLVLIACGDSFNQRDNIPNVYFEVEINLDGFDYVSLLQVGGYAYANGGVRGLILYRASSFEYVSFERNCPFESLETCAEVEVDGSTFFMIDPCCSSQFDWNGIPIEGPALLPMRTYYTRVQGNILTVSSEPL